MASSRLVPLSGAPPFQLGIYLNMRTPACCFWQRGLRVRILPTPLSAALLLKQPPPPHPKHLPSICPNKALCICPPAPASLQPPPRPAHSSPVSPFMNLNPRPPFRRHQREAPLYMSVAPPSPPPLCSSSSVEKKFELSEHFL